jgi:hypothetical protein
MGRDRDNGIEMTRLYLKTGRLRNIRYPRELGGPLHVFEKMVFLLHGNDERLSTCQKNDFAKGSPCRFNKKEGGSS